MTTPEAFTAELKTLAKDSARVATAGARGAAQHMRRSILDSVRSTPYARGFRNMGGTKLKVSYRIRGPVARVKATPPGPWQIAETGAKAHAIPKRGDVHRVLKIGGDFVRGPVTWRPRKTGGYHPFENGAARGEAGVQNAYRDALAKSLAKVF